MMGKDKNKDKEQDRETATSSETVTSPWDAHQSNRLQRQKFMHTTRLFSMTEAQLQFQPALRLLQEQMV